MSDNSIKILLIEDNPGDARLIRELFAEAGAAMFDLKCADRLSTGLTCLADEKIDLVLLDLLLPDSQGIETFTKLHSEVPEVPIVILSGLDDEKLAFRAVQDGAQSFIFKGQLDHNTLVRVIRYAIERHKILTELEETRQQQLRTQDQFFSHVSHELRSPLTAIYQFITVLLDGLAGDINPEQRKYLEIVLKNTNQLRTMIDDLLVVTRAHTGKLNIEPQIISLPKLIYEIFESQNLNASANGVNLYVDVPRDLSPAFADSVRVRQILVNLIENGIKFTPENGSINVKAQVYNEDSNFLCISVAD
ncbi:MAG: response regulator, partial [Thermodesulfobacteriota bacterium]